MKRPNPLPPDQMTAAERRAELCGLLALGLVRLMQRERGKPSDDTGEIPEGMGLPSNLLHHLIYCFI